MRTHTPRPYINQHEYRAKNHHGNIGSAKQCGKQFTTGNKTAGGIYREKDQNKNRRNSHQYRYAGLYIDVAGNDPRTGLIVSYGA